MEKDETYNGWKNRETWLVSLWMDNEEGSQRHWAQTTRDCILDTGDKTPNPYADHRMNAQIALAERLKNQHEEDVGEATGENGMMADLVGSALSRVDWDSIADHLLDAEWDDFMKDKVLEDTTHPGYDRLEKDLSK